MRDLQKYASIWALDDFMSLVRRGLWPTCCGWGRADVTHLVVPPGERDNGRFWTGDRTGPQESSSKLWVGRAGKTLPSLLAAILVLAEGESCWRCPLLVTHPWGVSWGFSLTSACSLTCRVPVRRCCFCSGRQPAVVISVSLGAGRGERPIPSGHYPDQAWELPGFCSWTVAGRGDVFSLMKGGLAKGVVC